MKLKTDTLVTTFDGKAIPGRIDPDDKDEDGNVKPAKSLTVGSVCIEALVGALPGEQLDGAEKFKRWELARRLHGVTEVDLKLEEATKVKECVGKAWSAMVVGAVWNALEDKDSKKEKKKE